MTRFRSILAGVGIASVLVLTSVPMASAVEPPPPVADVPDIPGRVIKSITGSPMGDKVVEILRAMAYMKLPAPAPAVAPAALPKVISPPQVLLRGGTTAMLAPAIGWALASNGTLAVMAISTGNDYESIFCQQPQWYQGVTSFVNLSIAPDCAGIINNPNADQETYQSFTFGGTNYFVSGLMGQGFRSGQGPTNVYCSSAPISSSVVIGGVTYNVYWEGRVGAPVGGTWTGTPCAAGTVTQHMRDNIAGTVGQIGRFGIKDQTTGAVVAQAALIAPNPERTPNCTIDWENGTTTTGTGTPYTESDGIPLSAAGLGCEEAYVSQPGRGPALMPSRIRVGSEDESGAITEISDQEVPDFTEPERKPFGPTTGRGLVLERIVGNQLLSCMTWAADCSGWWTATSEGTSQGTYRCTFGGEAVAIAECGIYRNTFELQTSTPTITDPQTGLDTPWVTAPTTGTGTGTSTGGFPSTGTNPSTGAATTTGGGGCTAGWSWNPVDWVINPLRCAFIPGTAAVVAAQTAVTASWEDSVIGSLQNGLTSLMGDFQVAEGCEGIPLHLEAFGTVLVHTQLLNACDEPYAGTAAVIKGLLTVACVITAILAFTRYLGSAFAFASFGNSKGNDNSGVSFR